MAPLFSMRAEIRKKLQDGHDPQPAAVSNALAAECPSRYLRLALSQALPYLVRDEIRKVRHGALGRAPMRDGKVKGKGQWEQIAATTGEDPANHEPDEGSRARGGTMAFSIFQVPVSLGPGFWKYLGDCTREEILDAAKFLYQRAAENEARGDGYRKLANVMARKKAATVSDLDPEKVRELVAPDEEAVPV